MKKVIGEKQQYFGDCMHGRMFFKKSSYIPEILCSSTLLVYAAYNSGQYLLRSVQQYKKKQLIK
jgi:hypothetical protein